MKEYLFEPKIIRGGKYVGHIEDIVVLKEMKGENISQQLLDILKVYAMYNECYKVILGCSEEIKKNYKYNVIKMYINEQKIETDLDSIIVLHIVKNNEYDVENITEVIKEEFNIDEDSLKTFIANYKYYLINNILLNKDTISEHFQYEHDSLNDFFKDNYLFNKIELNNIISDYVDIYLVPKGKYITFYLEEYYEDIKNLYKYLNDNTDAIISKILKTDSDRHIDNYIEFLLTNQYKEFIQNTLKELLDTCFWSKTKINLDLKKYPFNETFDKEFLEDKLVKIIRENYNLQKSEIVDILTKQISEFVNIDMTDTEILKIYEEPIVKLIIDDVNNYEFRTSEQIHMDEDCLKYLEILIRFIYEKTGEYFDYEYYLEDRRGLADIKSMLDPNNYLRLDKKELGDIEFRIENVDELQVSYGKIEYDGNFVHIKEKEKEIDVSFNDLDNCSYEKPLFNIVKSAIKYRRERSNRLSRTSTL